MSARVPKLDDPSYRIRLADDDLYVLEVWGYIDWVWMAEGDTPEECYAAYERAVRGGEAMNIDDMPLKIATRNALRRGRYMVFGVVIETSDDLAALSDEELLVIRNIGRTRLREIRNALAHIPEPDRSWLVGA